VPIKSVTKLIIFHRGGVEVFNGNYDDFLEKIGWEEEASNKKAKAKHGKAERIQNNLSKKEKDKEIRKLKKDISACEKRIMKFEKQMESLSQKIEKASEEQDMDILTELSQGIADTQELIDQEFESLSQLTESLEAQEV